MKAFADLADRNEDERIGIIGRTVMEGKQTVAFVVDDERGKANRTLSWTEREAMMWGAKFGIAEFEASLFGEWWTPSRWQYSEWRLPRVEVKMT